MKRVVFRFFFLILALAAISVAAAGQSTAIVGRTPIPYQVQGEKGQQDVYSQIPSVTSPILEKVINPSEYVLGPGDELVISILGKDSRSFSLSVLPEGYLFLPEIGSVHADGLTLDEFRAQLEKTLERYFRDVTVYCYLKSPARFRVFVTGEVARPGSVEVSSVERVTDAIAKAGGLAPTGSSRLITVERHGGKVPVDLERFLKQGRAADNPFLRSGDRVHVPPRGAFSVIYGEVKKPGWYELREGETIADLIDIAGGFTTDALRDSVVLARVQESGAVYSRTVRAEHFDEQLQDKDEVGVFSRFKYRKFVYVEGAIQRTGRIYLAENEGLTELVVRAGGFTTEADLSAAYVQKKTGKVIMVNLREYLAPNAEKNLPLDDGDVLAIPRIPKMVSVGGEVNNPGEFEYQGDMTVVQYVGLAGGPTKDGSIDRVVIYSRDGKVRSVSRDDLPGRGDVIVVKRAYSRIMADIFRGLIGAGSLIISVIILATN